MADPFIPKFVDLVRNYTATTGTGDFALGPAVNGFTGLAAALTTGDRFYYSCIGVDKPAEREVGRGTLTADGKVAREPVSGPKTNFTTGNKAIALVAAAEWHASVKPAIDAAASAVAAMQGQVDGTVQDIATLSDEVAAIGNAGARSVATRAELAGLNPASASLALLRESGREGSFVWDSSNLSAMVTADTAQGIHVAPASAPTGASGAWVRKFDGAAISTWFGVSTTATAAANATAMNQAIATLKNLGLAGEGYATGSVGLHTPTGVYEFNAALVISHAISLTGEYTGMFSGGGTIFEFPNATDGLSILGTATFVKLEGLKITGTSSVPGSGKHGLKVRGKVIVRDLYISGFDHGVDCYGNSGGSPYSNCNGSSFENIGIQSCAWGTWADGPDANNIRFLNVSPIANHLGGHFDSSFLGNIYADGDCSTNGRYGTTYISNCTDSGHIYMCMKGQETWCSTNAPTGAATSNQGWIYIGEGTAQAYQPQWTTGQTWYFSSSYAMDPDNNNARSRFRDIYVEPDQNPAIMTWPGLTYVGSDTGSVLTPSGAGYSGRISAGFGGELQMGDVSARSLSTNGYVNCKNTAGTLGVLQIDPAQQRISAGGFVNPGYDTNQALEITSWGTAQTAALQFRRNNADAAALSLYLGDLYLANQESDDIKFQSNSGAGVVDRADLNSAGFDLKTGAYKINGTAVISSAGKVTTVASTAGGAGIILPHGAAPTSPVDGDFWSTTAGFYVRVNGATVGPLGTGGGLSDADYGDITVSGGGTVMTLDGFTTAARTVAGTTNTIKLNNYAGVSFPAVDFDLNNGAATGTFRVGQISIAGTRDIFFQGIPDTAAGYTYLEAWQSAGLILGSGGNAGPVSIRVNRIEVASFGASGLTLPGSVTSSGATAGIGYATGAGGTVTQATSKSTGVTLNKVCGQITMNSAALAAAAIIEFTVTNSAIAATDTINLNLKSGAATTTAYRYWISAIAAGSFKVCVENRSTGSLAEALAFNFAVVKAVAA